LVLVYKEVLLGFSRFIECIEDISLPIGTVYDKSPTLNSVGQTLQIGNYVKTKNPNSNSVDHSPPIGTV
jgi:hypothetical protein